MLKILEKSLAQIPSYFSNFWLIMSDPHRQVFSMVEEDDDHISNAWIFFVVSMILTQAIRYTNLAGSFDFVNHLLFDVVKKTTILLSVAVAIYAALTLVKGRIAFQKVLATAIYFFGVANILIHLSFLLGNGFRSVNPCAYVEKQYGFSFLNCAELPAESLFGAGFWETMDVAVNFLVPLLIVVLSVWLLYAWFVWRKFVAMSFQRCLSALVIIAVFLPVIAIGAVSLLAV